MKEKLKTLFSLFITFFKIGLFTFGGGYAMIPLIEREVVTRKRWISSETLLETIAIAESTPGPIAINMATFIGSEKAGALGAAAATVGVVMPSFLIILVISLFLEDFKKLKVVSYAFRGIRAAVLALIIKAVFTLGKKTSWGVFSAICFAASFLLVAFLKVNAFFIIIGAALLGILYSVILRRKKGGEK